MTEQPVDYGTTAAELVDFGPELIKYQHYMNTKPISLPQRLHRRAGFIEGLQRARTMELEAGVVRVKIEAETIDRAAQALYERAVVSGRVQGLGLHWSQLGDEGKKPFVEQALAVFAVLPMQP